MKEKEEIIEKMEMADKYFNCSDRERIAFEVGIKLGALFHQFIGTPVSPHNIDILEKSIENTTESQAFVKSAEVNIKPSGSGDEDDENMGPFDYTTLTEDMIEAEVVIEYDGLRAVGEMRYVEEMNYPLMYIKEIDEI
ncbi:MAG: dihydroneopterin aldolase family protein [Candidatus Thermoplasmatota archaeon]